jgi:small subunit ribosomal protein S6
MKTYELTYIISPEITSQEAENKAREIETLIQSKEGIILKQNNPIAKTLAFPVKKHASGFFGILEFTLEPEKLLEVKEAIQKDGKIVRHMLIVKEPIRIRKERRSRIKIAENAPIETKIEIQTEAQKVEEPATVKTVSKEKVELKDIEQQLDEILGE